MTVSPSLATQVWQRLVKANHTYKLTRVIHHYAPTVNIMQLPALSLTLHSHNATPVSSYAMTGTASFAALKETALANNGLQAVRYSESGLLRQLPSAADAPSFPTTQSYIWQLQNDGAAIDVYFDEQPLRFFHPLQFKQETKQQTDVNAPQHALLVATAVHDCNPDTYHVTFSTPAIDAGTPVFTVEYRVQGPQKNYISLTKYDAEPR